MKCIDHIFILHRIILRLYYPDLTYMDGVEDNNLPVLNFVPVQSGTDYDDKVLSFCYHRAHKVSEIAEHLGNQ